MQEGLAFRGIWLQTFFLVRVVDFFGDEVVIFQIFDCEFAEIFSRLAFVTLCAGVVQQKASELYFHPCWGVRVSIK